MITGPRVQVTLDRGSIATGTVVAFLTSVGVGDGCVEWRDRVVTQTEDGRFIFAGPHQVRVLDEERHAERTEEVAAQPAQVPHRSRVRTVQDGVDRRQTPAGAPRCPEHRIGLESKKEPGTYYCAASVGAGYCTWTSAKEPMTAGRR